MSFVRSDRHRSLLDGLQAPDLDFDLGRRRSPRIRRKACQPPTASPVAP